MKIDHRPVDAYSRNALQPVGAARPVQKPQATEPSEGPAKSGEAAQVSFSAEAKALAAKSAPVDQAKVAALREKVQNGTFEVDAHKVAERLLDTIA